MLQRGPRNCCLALALLATAGVAQAASFDCNKASTEIEYEICRDPALSQLDGELGTVDRAPLAHALDAADQAQPKFRSHRLSDAESAAFAAWHSCGFFKVSARWGK